jgi:spermidine synthase
VAEKIDPSSKFMISFTRVLILAACSGFLALSWEILWARLFNVATGSRAPAFGAMLGSYLLGLALGSLWSLRWQRQKAAGSTALTSMIFFATVLSFIIAPLVSIFVVKFPTDYWTHGGINLASWLYGLPLVTLAAAAQGVILPWLCERGIAPDQRAGLQLSFVYLANIVGSGAGSLVTGFLLLEWLTFAQLALALTLSGFALAFLLVPAGSGRSGWLWRAQLALFALLVFFISPPLHRDLWERLSYKNKFTGQKFATVVESRHGVVCLEPDLTVYGNGAYDGKIGTDLHCGNWHVRPYFISAVHPQPRRILVIGMSAGAWTQILAHHPQLEHLDAIEISASYLKIIKDQPVVSSILTNPKVTIHIDDGRRWLRRHPEARYDAIVMNTTHHWREFAGALLSREFLTLARNHLAPGGIVMWNCTDSGRAAATGMDIFPHTMMCLNNCIGSLDPLTLDAERWRRVLSDYRIDGRPLFDLTLPEQNKELDDIVALTKNFRDEPLPPSVPDRERWWIMNRPQMQKLWGHLPLITDDNLGHEYQ